MAGIPFGLVSTIVAARILGPESFGRLTLLLFVFPFVASAIDLGYGTVTGWLVAANSVGNRRHLYAAVSSYVSWSLCKLPALVLVGIVLIGRHPLELAVYTGIAAGVLYLSVVQLVLAAERRFKAASLLNLLGLVASAVALMAAAALTKDYRISFLARTGGQLIIVPLVVAALEPGVRQASLHLGPIRLAREMRRYAAAGYVSFITSMWVFGRSETIFLNAAGRLVDLGRFSAATTISTRATLVSDALYASLDPSIVALQKTHGDVAGRAFVRMTRLGCIVGISTAVAVMPLAVVVAPALFGPGYQGMAAPIVVLTVASIVWTSVGPMNAWVIANRNLRAMIVPGVVAATADVVLAATLCPAFGLWGAIAASITATAIMLVALVAVGVDDRYRQREVARCAAYVVCVSVLAGLICLGAQGHGLLIGLVGAYAVVIAATYVLLRFLLPPVADRSDLEAIGKATPERLRSYLMSLLAPFARTERPI